jgi:uncharacterized protein (TIGR00255 family)
MTGFGRGEYKSEKQDFLVEIKTVNHRYSDLFLKLPRQLSFLEDKIRESISKCISRGKIDVFVSYEEYGDNSRSVLLDEPLAKAYLKSVEALKEKYNLKDDISVSLIARFPDVLKVEKTEVDEDETWQSFKKALDEALEALVKMRETEGAGLKKDMIERASYILGIVDNIDEYSPQVVKDYKQRLESRLKELLNQQVVDESRIATEVAIFADRCSINEEIVRLKSHIRQFKQTLDMDQPVGRKLDFIVQEMNREINTIDSKANDIEIAKHVVEIKSEIEKIREQIQNIE